MVLGPDGGAARSPAKRGWSPTTAFILGQETAVSPSFENTLGPRSLPVPLPSKKVAAKSALYKSALRSTPPAPSPKHERPGKNGGHNASPAGAGKGWSSGGVQHGRQDGEGKGRIGGGVDHCLASVVVRVRPASHEEQLDPDFAGCIAVDEDAGTVQVESRIHTG